MKSSRSSMRGVLTHLKTLAFDPATIIDVGAAMGTPELYDTYHAAHYLLIEPLIEFEPFLQELCQGKDRWVYALVAAGAHKAQKKMYIHPDLYGSTFYKEHIGSEADGFERILNVVTLDQLCQEHELGGPYLVKLDTQGSELDVLQGAHAVLQKTEVILMEVSLIMSFFDGSPDFFPVVSRLRGKGFVVYDLYGEHYRPLDGARAQVDLVFVKEEGQFRNDHRWADSEQLRDYHMNAKKKLKDKFGMSLGI